MWRQRSKRDEAGGRCHLSCEQSPLRSVGRCTMSSSIPVGDFPNLNGEYRVPYHPDGKGLSLNYESHVVAFDIFATNGVIRDGPDIELKLDDRTVVAIMDGCAADGVVRLVLY